MLETLSILDKISEVGGRFPFLQVVHFLFFNSKIFSIYFPFLSED